MTLTTSELKNQVGTPLNSCGESAMSVGDETSQRLECENLVHTVGSQDSWYHTQDPGRIVDPDVRAAWQSARKRDLR